MQQYLDLLEDVLKNGSIKNDRTGTGTISLFGRQMRFDLCDGFPLVTTKKIYIKSVIHELLWFLKGDTNIKYLNDNGVNIWNQWADENGDLGPIYGKQWRDFSGVDQINEVIHSIKHDPYSRRHIISAWNVPELSDMKLMPCHCLFQFYVNNNKLSCQLYQRSADIFLGVPFNIASYSLLTMMIAKVCKLQLGEFIHTFGDVHLYKNHIDHAKFQLTRKPYDLPIMKINSDIKDILKFTYDDFELINYKYHPHILADVSV